MTVPGAAHRRLLHVPIVHTAEDLGSLAGEAQRRLSRVLGSVKAERRSAAIVKFWNGLQERIPALPLEWARTRLYQDGLPVSGHELAIVKDLAAKGNLNHSLLLSLVERGATLMGTEDPELLLREYRRIQRVARAVPADVGTIRREGDLLLRERDAFIARRIDETLREGESAILFMGHLHRVDELLRDRLEIQSFSDSLPAGAEPWRKKR